MIGRTDTSVHDAAGMMRQRWDALARDHCALCGMGIYSQIFIGLSICIYDRVSTPGWLSLLLTLPYILLIIFWAYGLARRSNPQAGVLVSCAGEKAARLLCTLPALSFFLDAALIFYALCAMLQDVLPDMNPVWISLSVSVFTAFSLTQKNEFALPRLARLMRWLIALPLLYCAVITLPHGSIAHFFPLLGFGFPSIFRGAAWLCGTVSSCCWPLIMQQNEKSLFPILEKRRVLLFPVLRAVIWGLLTMLVSVWLLPVYAMARPQGLGWRILLVTNMTPSVAAWSLEVIGLMLLLLLSLSGAVTQAAQQLVRIYGKEKASPAVIYVLLLLLFPLGAWPIPAVEQALLTLAPWRAALMLGLLLALSVGQLVKRKKAERQALQ